MSKVSNMFAFSLHFTWPHILQNAKALGKTKQNTNRDENNDFTFQIACYVGIDTIWKGLVLGVAGGEGEARVCSGKENIMVS